MHIVTNDVNQIVICLTMDIPDECHSRNASCALNYIPTLILCVHYTYEIIKSFGSNTSKEPKQDGQNRVRLLMPEGGER